MERQETELIMMILETAYPQFYARKTIEDRKNALRLWHMMFEGDSGAEVGAAVKAFIAMDTKGFPPAIGQIKQKLVQLHAPDMLDESQAWALVAKAIKRSAYHAQAEYDKLPPIIQKVIGSASMLHAWALTSGDELQTVVASNFQRAYRARAAEAKEILALPPDIRRILERKLVKTLPE